MSVTVDFDFLGISDRVEAANDLAIVALSQQALQDCNYYCKEDVGILIDSSINNSDFENGLLVWDTLYAAKQYYLEAAYKDKNPNAQMMWAHKAKDVHCDEWLQVYKNTFRREMG